MRLALERGHPLARVLLLDNFVGLVLPISKITNQTCEKWGAQLLGPDFLSLQVRNLSASRAFYTELLGLTVDERFTAPDFVLFDTNSIPFGISEAKVNLDEAPQRTWTRQRPRSLVSDTPASSAGS
jgi:hypothetical protein